MSVELYKIYGLTVESELAFPHWPGIVEFRNGFSPDLTIKIGAIDNGWNSRTPAGQWYLVEREHVFIKIENVGRFLISNGDCVVYEPVGDGIEDAWLYVEGAITGAILHQRRIWPLHGSAVLKPDGQIAAFVGQRGIGKSTLLFELQNRGYSVVADDIVAIDFDREGRPMVHPGFPQGKLCSDAVENFGLDVSQLRPLRNSVGNKFAVKYERDFVDTQRQLSEVYVLERHGDQGLRFRELVGLEKLRQLSDNTYRLELLATAEDYQRLFRNILTASNHMRTYRLERPAEGNSVRELASFLDDRWKIES